MMLPAMLPAIAGMLALYCACSLAWIAGVVHGANIAARPACQYDEMMMTPTTPTTTAGQPAPATPATADGAKTR